MANSNKEKIAGAMDAMATGDLGPFGALMHPEVTWSVAGSNSWSGKYEGLDAVRRDLLAPLFANFTTRYVNKPINIVAEGDFVVVECRGQAMTKSGKSYEQAYCYVIRMQGGMIKSVVEYMDTELVTRALGPRVS